MLNTDVPRNSFLEQAAIAKLAVEGKVKLEWDDEREVIRVKQRVCYLTESDAGSFAHV